MAEQADARDFLHSRHKKRVPLKKFKEQKVANSANSYGNAELNQSLDCKCVETIYHPPKSVMIWRRHSPDYNIYLDGLGNHNQE